MLSDETKYYIIYIMEIIRQNLYGDDHIETSHTMHNLAIAYLYW